MRKPRASGASPCAERNKRSFIGLGHWHLSNHAPTEQDDRTIASERDLGKFRSEQQHCGSLSR